MTRRIAIIQGHPDPAGHHLLHALADAYAEGAKAGGHEVRSIEVAALDFPLLRTQEEFETGALPPALVGPCGDLRWAEHWVFLFPLWHGTMPALLKGFLEHVFRPGFAMDIRESGLPRKLLAGRSARIVVTMGMPVLVYRWYFGGLRASRLRAQHPELRRHQARSGRASTASPAPTSGSARAGSRHAPARPQGRLTPRRPARGAVATAAGTRARLPDGDQTLRVKGPVRRTR
jgi:putative NADPH-quinone reductase